MQLITLSSAKGVALVLLMLSKGHPLINAHIVIVLDTPLTCVGESMAIPLVILDTQEGQSSTVMPLTLPPLTVQL